MEHSGFRLVLLKYIPVYWFYSVQTSGTTSYEIAGVLAECFFVLREGWTVTRFERFWTLSKPCRLKRRSPFCENMWAFYFYKKSSLTRISCHLYCFATNQWYNTHAGVKHGPITKMKFCKIPLSAASLFCVPPVHSCLFHLFWYCRTGIAFGFVKKNNFKGVWRSYCQLYIGR